MVRCAPERWARDTHDLEKALVKALRHGRFGLRGLLEVGGWIRLRVVADRLNVTVDRIKAAIQYDARSIRPRLQNDPAQETVGPCRAIAHCSLSVEQVLAEGRISGDELAGIAAAHGDTLSCLEHAVSCWQGGPGIVLTGPIEPHLIRLVEAVGVGSPEFSVLVARGSPERGLVVEDDADIEHIRVQSCGRRRGPDG